MILVRMHDMFILNPHIQPHPILFVMASLRYVLTTGKASRTGSHWSGTSFGINIWIIMAVDCPHSTCHIVDIRISMARISPNTHSSSFYSPPFPTLLHLLGALDPPSSRPPRDRPRASNRSGPPSHPAADLRKQCCPGKSTESTRKAKQRPPTANPRPQPGLY